MISHLCFLYFWLFQRDQRTWPNRWHHKQHQQGACPVLTCKDHEKPGTVENDYHSKPGDWGVGKKRPAGEPVGRLRQPPLRWDGLLGDHGDDGRGVTRVQTDFWEVKKRLKERKRFWSNTWRKDRLILWRCWARTHRGEVSQPVVVHLGAGPVGIALLQAVVLQVEHGAHRHPLVELQTELIPQHQRHAAALIGHFEVSLRSRMSREHQD